MERSRGISLVRHFRGAVLAIVHNMAFETAQYGLKREFAVWSKNLM
jgi:hypothetical protein